MDELLKWRGEFPILDRTTYMISNSLGAMPRGVYQGLRSYADSWAERGVRAWEEGWWEMAVGVGDQIAPLIGAGQGEISLHQNVTLTQAVISSCFDFRGPRNKIVMVELEFPSIQYFYHEQRRLGARVEVVPTPDHIRIDLDSLLAAIDETTLLVPISQVLFRSSCIVDARAIIERAHRVGAHVILDVFQAAGSIPLDVRSLGVDFAVGGVLKWLCGGPGVAYLYVREDLRAKPTHSCTVCVPARTGDCQQSWHRSNPREIHAHDHTPHRRRPGSRLAREHTGKPSGACGDGFRGMPACLRGLPGTPRQGDHRRLPP